MPAAIPLPKLRQGGSVGGTKSPLRAFSASSTRRGASANVCRGGPNGRALTATVWAQGGQPPRGASGPPEHPSSADPVLQSSQSSRDAETDNHGLLSSPIVNFDGLATGTQPELTVADNSARR